MSDLLRAQLYAMRYQLDAIILSVEGPNAPAPAAPGSCPSCGAPEEKQAAAGNLGNPGLKKCLICQAEY